MSLNNGRGPLALALPDELLDAVVERVLEVIDEREPADNWLTATEAADYLRCPTSRIYALAGTKPARIPVHRDGSRLLFRRAELDGWVEQGGGKRP